MSEVGVQAISYIYCNKKLGSISPVLEVRKNWGTGGINARTSCLAYLVLRCAAAQLWGGLEALRAAPADSRV
jgi:hypothetical protein